MKKQMRLFMLTLVGCMLAFGFQNCGTASYNSSEYIKDSPLSSILNPTINFNDTRYKDGFSFKLIEPNKNNGGFGVGVSSNGAYLVSDANKIYSCEVSTPNPLAELLQFFDVVNVTNPVMLAEPPTICESTSERDSQHIQIGVQSPLYLIARDLENNCLLDDPQQLIAEGKKVFIIENMGANEISQMIQASQDLTKTPSCDAVMLNSL